MCWLKRDIWKAGIAIIGMLLLLVLTVWLPAPAASAYEVIPGLAGPVTVTVQATPTVDATVSVLNKEQLTLQVKQLQNQLQTQNNWFFSNSTGIIAAFSAIIIALFGLYQWGENRKDEHTKEQYAKVKDLEDRAEARRKEVEAQDKDLKDKAEARFQAAVTGLGDEKEGAKVGAAILLRTFLRPGYEQFYTQTFDLAVANLRLPRIPHVSEDPDGVPYQPKDQESSLPLTTLSQALIVAFKEAFPLARNTLIGDKKDALQSLDATNIQLDNASLREADLKQAWMQQASLRKANLRGANLSNANLSGANLSGANLSGADLSGAYLIGANLSRADLIGANLNNATLIGTNLFNAHPIGATLSGADLSDAYLSGAELNNATLSDAYLSGADLSEAYLIGANLSGADLSGADLRSANLSGADLSGVNLENARSLEGTKLYGVTGLDEKQVAGCELKGAIIDKDSTTSSTQSTVSPSPLSSSNDVQAPLAPSTQEDLPSPDVGSSAASS